MKKIAHRGETLAHAAYFGLVAIEAHGNYGIAAGVCLALLIVNMLAGSE